MKTILSCILFICLSFVQSLPTDTLHGTIHWTKVNSDEITRTYPTRWPTRKVKANETEFIPGKHRLIGAPKINVNQKRLTKSQTNPRPDENALARKNFDKQDQQGYSIQSLVENQNIDTIRPEQKIVVYVKDTHDLTVGFITGVGSCLLLHIVVFVGIKLFNTGQFQIFKNRQPETSSIRWRELNKETV